MEIKNRVQAFILSNFYVTDASSLTESTPLLATGIVDSTGVLEVVAFLEEQFDIKVQDDEMLPENLDSIAQIAAYVKRKRDAQLLAS